MSKGRNEPYEFDQEFITRAGIEMRDWIKAELAEGQKYPEKERFRLGILGNGKHPGKVVAETYPAELSDDGTVEHIIRMDEDDPKKLITYLLLQQIRGVTGPKLDDATRRLAVRVGFDDRVSLKVPTARKELAQKVDDLAARRGELPFKKLRFQEGKIIGRKKKQTTRMLKAECKHADGCGYTVRLAQSWLKAAQYGPPMCPKHQVALVAEEKEEAE